MDNTDVTLVNVAELAFDTSNPRLVEFGLSEDSTGDEIIRILWNAMDVEELVMSIAASGFFRHEPLIVTQEDGKKTVIEGNRRLAAVKLLLKPQSWPKIESKIPAISASRKKALQEIPVVLDTRQGAWRYLGFKHVNGPAKWGSYAKAQYIANVHRNYSASLRDIANQIGDTHKTVQRLFRGLMVIEQAEHENRFNREDRWHKHFSFSHLYTGLDYPGISAFIGLRPEVDENERPVPNEKLEHLGELCRWIYGSKREELRPLIVSQNPHLRQLDRVLTSSEALAALRDSESLGYAYELSRPASTVFEESLLGAKRHLQKARSMLSTGYNSSEDLLRIAGSVADLADDLYSEMERKRDPEKRKRGNRISENF